MYKNFLCLFLILFVFVLISCEYRYKDYYLHNNCQIEQWKKHQKLLLNMVNYKAHGGVICAICEKKIRLQFFLQKVNQKHYRVILTDFIGFNNIQINILENGEYFIHKDMKNNFRFFDFEKLIKKSIDERMLIKNFLSWLIGLPGTAVNFTINNNNVIQKINYQYDNTAVTILYKSYYTDIVSFLPKVIEMHYGQNVYLHIKIYKWII